MDFTGALLAENAAFTGVVRDADLSTPMPTCPGWTLDQLIRHLGRGDRWCAQIVDEQSAEYIDPRSVPGAKPPAGREGMMTWLRDGPLILVDAVARTGPNTPVWTFLGPRPADWWIRRRLHETVVHRADAALAVGAEFSVDPAVAADCITEYLEIRAAGRTGDDQSLASGQSVNLHATDPGLGEAGERTIVGRPDGIAVVREHGKATAAVRGPVRDVLLAVVRRGTVATLGLELSGDVGVWDTLLARTPF